MTKGEWTQGEGKEKDMWWGPAQHGEKLQPRIKMLDAKTYACYRNGKYLGCEGDLKTARERIAANVLSERNREMEWQKTQTELGIPLGLQLTQEERTAQWDGHVPPAPKRVTGGKKKETPDLPPKENPVIYDRDNATGDFNKASNFKPAKEPAPVKERAPRGERSRTTQIAELLRKGCTREDVLKATGWPSVSMQVQAKQAGLTLTVDKSSKPFRYKAT